MIENAPQGLCKGHACLDLKYIHVQTFIVLDRLGSILGCDRSDLIGFCSNFKWNSFKYLDMLVQTYETVEYSGEGEEWFVIDDVDELSNVDTMSNDEWKSDNCW